MSIKEKSESHHHQGGPHPHSHDDQYQPTENHHKPDEHTQKHGHGHPKQTLQEHDPDGPIKSGLSWILSQAAKSTAPVQKTILHSKTAQYIAKQTQALGQTRAGAMLHSIPHRSRVLGAAFAAAGAGYTLSPDAIGLNIAAIAAGFYLMHHTSEYALSDINTLGKKAGWSAIGMGMISGLVHSANEAAVSISSVINGNTDLALSAVVSHQGFHTLGILGAVAAIAGVS